MTYSNVSCSLSAVWCHQLGSQADSKPCSVHRAQPVLAHLLAQSQTCTMSGWVV
jgi:hypothetical protein